MGNMCCQELRKHSFVRKGDDNEIIIHTEHQHSIKSEYEQNEIIPNVQFSKNETQHSNDFKMNSLLNQLMQSSNLINDNVAAIGSTELPFSSPRCIEFALVDEQAFDVLIRLVDQIQSTSMREISSPSQEVSGQKVCKMADSGDYYIGTWNSQNQREGFGRFVTQTGIYYEGEWKNDCFQGQGIYVELGRFCIKGSFMNNLPHGNCMYIKLNQDLSQIIQMNDLSLANSDSQFQKEIMNSVQELRAGIRERSVKDLNKEMVNSSLRENINILVPLIRICSMDMEYVPIKKDRSTKVAGTMEKNRVMDKNIGRMGNHIKVEYSFSNRIRVKIILFLIQGEYKDDHFSGYGQLVYENGDIYEGYWKNGELHGQGILKSPNNPTVYHEWVNGKQVEFIQNNDS